MAYLRIRAIRESLYGCPWPTKKAQRQRALTYRRDGGCRAPRGGGTPSAGPEPERSATPRSSRSRGVGGGALRAAVPGGRLSWFPGSHVFEVPPARGEEAAGAGRFQSRTGLPLPPPRRLWGEAEREAAAAACHEPRAAARIHPPPAPTCAAQGHPPGAASTPAADLRPPLLPFPCFPPAPAGPGMSISIPAGLTELLQGFTVEVLRSQPADLLEFALQYFGRLKEEAAAARAAAKEKEASGRRAGTPAPGHDRGQAPRRAPPDARGVNFAEEPMQTDSESGEDEEQRFPGEGRRPRGEGGGGGARGGVRRVRGGPGREEKSVCRETRIVLERSAAGERQPRSGEVPAAPAPGRGVPPPGARLRPWGCALCSGARRSFPHCRGRA